MPSERGQSIPNPLQSLIYCNDVLIGHRLAKRYANKGFGWELNNDYTESERTIGTIYWEMIARN